MPDSAFVMGGNDQVVQDAALTRRRVFVTFFSQCRKLRFKCMHALEPFPHALQLAVDQSIDVAAISVRVGDEIQQGLDIDQRHVQRSAMADEGQSPDVLLAVFPVAISPPGGWP